MSGLPRYPDGSNSSLWLTLPNALSFLRLLLGMVFPWLPVEWRLTVVVIAAISDLLDGSLGRATQTTSTLGRVLDPVADKVFVLGVLVALILDGTFALWQVALLLLRDVGVALRAIWELRRSGAVEALRYSPSLLGKLTTALQFLTLFVVFWGGEVMLLVLIPTAVVSGLAGVDYLLRARN